MQKTIPTCLCNVTDKLIVIFGLSCLIFHIDNTRLEVAVCADFSCACVLTGTRYITALH